MRDTIVKMTPAWTLDHLYVETVASVMQAQIKADLETHSRVRITNMARVRSIVIEEVRAAMLDPNWSNDESNMTDLRLRSLKRVIQEKIWESIP